MKKKIEQAIDPIFGFPLDESVVECGRVGLTFERTFDVLMIRLSDDLPLSAALRAQRRDAAYILWKRGVEIGNAQITGKLRARFDADLSGSYADYDANRRQQSIENEIKEQFGDNLTN